MRSPPGLELTRFRGHLTLWGGGIHYAEIETAIPERHLMLPPTLTKRLINHPRPNDVAEGYAADWTLAQPRTTAQRISDPVGALMHRNRI